MTRHDPRPPDPVAAGAQSGTEPASLSAKADPIVLYNGACPICAREIAAYRRAAARDGAALAFEDLNEADLAHWGVDPEEARRRLHVRQGDAVLSGLPAFLALWQALPRMRWLARLVSLPVIRPLATLGYDRVAAPLLHALDRRRRALSRRRRAR
jgi:predicted DCC family thiol-disulfide oxidoreductase YuxK